MMASSDSQNGPTMTLGDSTTEMHRIEETQQTPAEDPEANLIVNYIPNSMRDEQLNDLFSAYGTVMSARIIKDKATQRSLGYGFVKFSNALEAATARQALNGHRVDEKTLKVAVARPQGTERNTNVYVAGLDPHVTQEELHTLFATYGRVIETKILYDKVTNVSRGVGFVKFERAEDAEAAIKNLHNFVHRGGKPLVVRLAEQKDKNKQPMMSAAMHQRSPMRYPPYGMYNPLSTGSVDPTWAYPYGQAYQAHPQAAAAMGLYHPAAAQHMQTAAPQGMQGMHAMQSMQGVGPMSQQMQPMQAGHYCLFIYNLPPETDENYLLQLFSPYGNVTQVKVMRDVTTQLCKGFGFVNYVKYEEAQSAILALNGAQIGSKTLQVSFKRDRQQSSVPR